MKQYKWAKYKIPQPKRRITNSFFAEKINPRYLYLGSPYIRVGKKN